MNQDHLCPDTLLTEMTDGVAPCSPDSLFEIDFRGEWFYRKSPLPVKFCKLFAGILHHIEGDYLLITPAERLKVAVESEALIILDYERQENESYRLKTSIGSEHLIEDIGQFTLTDEGIFIILERGIEARLGRACYYRFINEFVTG